MNKATIAFGKGSLRTGFALVTMQLWQDGQLIVKQQGQLPKNPQLAELYRHWRSLYLAYYQNSRPPLRIDFVADESPLNFSLAEFKQVCQQLKDQLNIWLDNPSFTNIPWHLGIHLHPREEIEIVIETEELQIRQLPWHQWNFLENYPWAEIALSLPEYKQASFTNNHHPSKIKVLGVIGNPVDNELETDRAILEQMPQARVKFLERPTIAEFKKQLRQDWDIFFFAGHSSSEVETGKLLIDREDHTIGLSELEPALKYSIQQGLKLAIFNSCDGLELAWSLAKLNISQTIVMSQPVSDRVAQEFLKHFLAAITQGKSTYIAVRQAREQLKDLEPEYPCASWLPTLCQNPAASNLTWRRSIKTPNKKNWQFKNVITTTAIASIVSAVTIVTRSLSLWQGIELKTYDWFRKMQPNFVDDRFLLVTIDEADIQYQDRQGIDRRGSLGDEALLQALTKLQSYRPQTIALDIYHDFPFQPELAPKIAQTNAIAACEIARSTTRPYSIAPPPNMPIERVGFTDFPLDPDNMVRRQLLFMDSTVSCPTDTSFSLRVALDYLAQTSNVTGEFTAQGDLKIGDVVLTRLSYNSGGYQLPPEEALGYQVLFNYPQAKFSHISLRDLLEEGSDAQLADLVKDKIVLIGAGASSKDSHLVSHSQKLANREISGMAIHARTIERIINAVESKTPLLWWWTQPQEYLWLIAWSGVGGIVVLYSTSKSRLIILFLSALSILIGITVFLFTRCGWIPFFPAVFTLTSTCAIGQTSEKTNEPK